MTRLLPHQQAWLNAHPKRDMSWLKDALKNGFDVHHLDGDHDNNEPDNLVLIEGEDHMRLHSGGSGCLRSLGPIPRGVRRSSDVAADERAYALRCSGKTWREIGETMDTCSMDAVNKAKRHASSIGAPLPKRCGA